MAGRMIEGYDDYRERIHRGIPAYTHEGLVNKINAQQDEIYASRDETAFFRDRLTEMLGMEWKGGVCPSDTDIVAEVERRIKNEGGKDENI